MGIEKTHNSRQTQKNNTKLIFIKNEIEEREIKSSKKRSMKQVVIKQKNKEK